VAQTECLKSVAKTNSATEAEGDSAGTTAGIVVGVITGVCCCIAVLGYIYYRRTKANERGLADELVIEQQKEAAAKAARAEEGKGKGPQGPGGPGGRQMRPRPTGPGGAAGPDGPRSPQKKAAGSVAGVNPMHAMAAGVPSQAKKEPERKYQPPGMNTFKPKKAALGNMAAKKKEVPTAAPPAPAAKKEAESDSDSSSSDSEGDPAKATTAPETGKTAPPPPPTPPAKKKGRDTIPPAPAAPESEPEAKPAGNLVVPKGVGGPDGPVMDSFAPMRLAMAQGFNLNSLKKVGDRDSASDSAADKDKEKEKERERESAESEDRVSGAAKRYTVIEDDVIPDMRESTQRAPSFVGKGPPMSTGSDKHTGGATLEEGDEDEEDH
jgi:hypothetical protein